MEFELEIEGGEWPELEKLPGAVSVLLKDIAIKARDIVESQTPKGDPKRDRLSGNLKKSWSQVQEGEAYSFSFSTNVPYAVVVEEGRYKGVGPRTIKMPGGIFSRQARYGMIQPLLDDRTFVDRIVNDVMNQMIERIKESA